MRVAGILVNIVPYHHARWEAYSRASGVECHVVELTDRDAFRVLEFSATSSYRRHTLFARGRCETFSTEDLRREMNARLNAIQPEVLCVSGWALSVSLAALQWATRKRVPIVVLSESSEVDEPRSSAKEFIKRRIVGLCSAGLAGGGPQADYLAKLGLSSSCIFQGYDAVDNDYFAQGTAKVRSQSSVVRDQLGLPSAPFFLACSRFGKKKNIPRLIEAYAHYCQLVVAEDHGLGTAGREPWKLVVAGDGEMRPEIEAAIGRWGVKESVQLVGAQPYAAMPSYYGLASVFIHASTTEQWGLVVNESMTSGLAVLVSNRCGCAPDLVRDGVNGFTFDPLNVGQLARLMLKVSAFDFPLSEFGAESAGIISKWGPERFASGLKAAVDTARAVGPIKPTLLQRATVQLLLRR